MDETLFPIMFLSATVLMLSAALLITVRAFFRQRERHRLLRKEFSELMKRRPLSHEESVRLRQLLHGRPADRSSAADDRAGEAVSIGQRQPRFTVAPRGTSSKD